MWFSDSREWSSGSWSLRLRGDELADISFDGTVVLRSVRAVVRDRNWSTATLLVDRVRAGDTTLTLHVRSEGLDSGFHGVVRVEARPSRLDVTCDLGSRHPFDTNRTGLVVLHPPALAGADLAVTHPSGAVERAVFPVDISPHQPAFDIAQLAWRYDGIDVSIAFDGDVFEMEDQRNWTDASFKTYSRPLALGSPYRISAGERVRQTVSVIASRAEASGDAAAPAISLRAGGSFPAIGVGASTAPDPTPAFSPLGSEVLVELDLGTVNWRAALARARSAGVRMDVRFVADHPAQFAAGLAALDGLDVVRVGVYRRDEDVSIDSLPSHLPVVGGARSHFTELNRQHHRLPADLDGLTVTVTPLFHALGTEQLVESIAMQRLVARQTVFYADGIPVHIGPVTLRPRSDGLAPLHGSARTDLAEGYGAEFTQTADERQSAPELAAWTIASAAALAVPGVASVAWFEEWGPRGIRDRSGEPWPVAAAIEALSELQGGTLLSGASPDGLVWALGSVKDGESVLVANLDRVERVVHMTTPTGRTSVTVEPQGWVAVSSPG